MIRLVNQLKLDLTVQWRSGFYLASAVLIVPTVILLQFLSNDVLAWALPLVLFQNSFITTFFFVSGQVLLERTDSTLSAQAITPLKPWEYWASKILTLAGLSTAEGLLIAYLTFDGVIALPALFLSLMGLGSLLTLAGLLVIGRYESINAFLMPAVGWQLAGSIPVLRILGVIESPLVAVHPLEPSMRALESAFAREVASPALWLLILAFWLIAMAWLLWQTKPFKASNTQA